MLLAILAVFHVRLELLPGKNLLQGGIILGLGLLPLLEDLFHLFVPFFHFGFAGSLLLFR